MYLQWTKATKNFQANLKGKEKEFSLKLTVNFPKPRLSEEFLLRIRKTLKDIKDFPKNLLKKIVKKSPIQIEIKIKRFSGRTAKYLGIAFVIVGFILLSFPYLYKYLIVRRENQQAKPYKFTAVANAKVTFGINGELIKVNTQTETLRTSSPPEKIIIPSLAINLKVEEAKIKDGFWETSETNASHGQGTANPGEKGNMVIFAHAREGLFLPLKDIKEKDTIYVLSKDKWYEYEVVEIKSVAPTQIEVIAPTPDETLTLYTCTGFFDSQRLIVRAKPKRS